MLFESKRWGIMQKTKPNIWVATRSAFHFLKLTKGLYRMSGKNTKSHNGHVYDISYKRLKLKRREKIILQRLLGFLLRNNKPFPFSRKSLSELTGYSKSSIDESLNILENYRLIERIGFTRRVKFTKGSILTKICTLAQNRINKEQVNKSTLAQFLGESSSISPVSGYKKTSSSLKRKERGVFYDPLYQEYVGRLKADKEMKLVGESVELLTYEEWAARRN